MLLERKHLDQEDQIIQKKEKSEKDDITEKFKKQQEKLSTIKKQEEVVKQKEGNPEDLLKKSDTEKKEEKESFESMMGWEAETFKISSEGCKTETKKYEDGKDINVKVSPAGDVFEYMDGPAKGEQIFLGYENFLDYVAKSKGCTTEEAEKKYLMTSFNYQKKMKQIQASEEKYKEFFNKEIVGHLAGYWNPLNKKFINLGITSSFWLADGNAIDIHRDEGDRYYYYSNYGFSARLLKK